MQADHANDAASSFDDAAVVRLSGVGRSFHTRTSSMVALENVDLSLTKGEFTCLVGPSGCGKSTLLRMVAGLIRPNTGIIELDSTSDTRPLCATVFQDYSVFPWRTVLQNVRYGLQVGGVPKKEANEQAREWIARVGLEGFENSYPASLSGGMKQRVALARAMAVRPQILLMDEPFAAVDAQLRLVLQDELLDLWQSAQQTVLFVTHGLDEAVLLGDRIAVMSARPGRIKSTMPVNLPRPRTSDVRFDPEFQAAERHLWDSLREEVIAGRDASGRSI